MNGLKATQNEIKKMLLAKYSIKLSIKEFERYLFLFSKWAPAEQIKMNEALDNILENPSTFAYFILGARSEYVNHKNLLTKKRKHNAKSTISSKH